MTTKITIPPAELDRRTREAALLAQLVANRRVRINGTTMQTVSEKAGFREWDGTYGDGHGFCGLNCEAAFGRVALKVLQRLPKQCDTCGARIAWDVER